MAASARGTVGGRAGGRPTRHQMIPSFVSFSSRRNCRSRGGREGRDPVPPSLCARNVLENRLPMRWGSQPAARGWRHSLAAPSLHTTQSLRQPLFNRRRCRFLPVASFRLSSALARSPRLARRPLACFLLPSLPLPFLLLSVPLPLLLRVRPPLGGVCARARC